MRGFLVRRGRPGRPIDLLQKEALRVIRLLDQVEPGNAWLLNTRPSVGKCGIDKGLNGLRPNMNMNVNNQHGAPIMQRATVLLNWRRSPVV